MNHEDPQELRNRHYNRTPLSPEVTVIPVPAQPLSYEDKLRDPSEGISLVQAAQRYSLLYPWGEHELDTVTKYNFPLIRDVLSIRNIRSSPEERADGMVRARELLSLMANETVESLDPETLRLSRKFMRILDEPKKVGFAFFDDTPINGVVTRHEFNVRALRGARAEFSPFFALIGWFNLMSNAYLADLHLGTPGLGRPFPRKQTHISELWVSADGRFIERPRKLYKLRRRGLMGVFTRPDGFIQQSLYRGKFDEIFVERFTELMEKQINRVERATTYLVEPSVALRDYSHWINGEIINLRHILDEYKVLAAIGR